MIRYFENLARALLGVSYQELNTHHRLNTELEIIRLHQKLDELSEKLNGQNKG